MLAHCVMQDLLYHCWTEGEPDRFLTADLLESFDDGDVSLELAADLQNMDITIVSTFLASSLHTLKPWLPLPQRSEQFMVSKGTAHTPDPKHRSTFGHEALSYLQSPPHFTNPTPTKREADEIECMADVYAALHATQEDIFPITEENMDSGHPESKRDDWVGPSLMPNVFSTPSRSPRTPGKDTVGSRATVLSTPTLPSRFTPNSLAKPSPPQDSFQFDGDYSSLATPPTLTPRTKSKQRTPLHTPGLSPVGNVATPGSSKASPFQAHMSPMTPIGASPMSHATDRGKTPEHSVFQSKNSAAAHREEGEWEARVKNHPISLLSHSTSQDESMEGHSPRAKPPLHTRSPSTQAFPQYNGLYPHPGPPPAQTGASKRPHIRYRGIMETPGKGRAHVEGKLQEPSQHISPGPWLEGLTEGSTMVTSMQLPTPSASHPPRPALSQRETSQLSVADDQSLRSLSLLNSFAELDASMASHTSNVSSFGKKTSSVQQAPSNTVSSPEKSIHVDFRSPPRVVRSLEQSLTETTESSKEKVDSGKMKASRPVEPTTVDEEVQVDTLELTQGASRNLSLSFSTLSADSPTARDSPNTSTLRFGRQPQQTWSRSPIPTAEPSVFVEQDTHIDNTVPPPSHWSSVSSPNSRAPLNASKRGSPYTSRFSTSPENRKRRFGQGYGGSPGTSQSPWYTYQRVSALRSKIRSMSSSPTQSRPVSEGDWEYQSIPLAPGFSSPYGYKAEPVPRWYRYPLTSPGPSSPNWKK